ncbi:MAG TPA: class I SAM-dependent methyltransferase [Candidatus Limnocylindrales bacterium]
MQDNLRRYSMPSAGIYDRLTSFLFRKRYDEIAREIAAAAPPGAAVLDAGCGPGEVLVRLAGLAPSLRLTGLDVDAPMIDRARAKARRAGVSPTLVVGDATAMPFEDGSFDLVVSSFAVHHWPDPNAGLAEVMRVLKPGGRAIIWDVTAPAHGAAPEHGAPTHGAAPEHGAPAHGSPAHGSPAHGAPTHGAPTHGHGAAEAGAPRVVVRRTEIHGPSWLTALRMLRQFGRMQPHKFEFAKAPEA